ncbi:hypothetical protein ACFX13_006327 [Malus domestica]
MVATVERGWKTLVLGSKSHELADEWSHFSLDFSWLPFIILLFSSFQGMSQQPSIQNATPKDLQGYKWRFRHITQGEDESGLERLHQCADNELQVCLNDKEFQ